MGMELVSEMAIDNESLEDKLNDHDDRIRNLEIQSARTDERLGRMEQNQEKLDQKLEHGMQRLDNRMLEVHNSILKLFTDKDNNKTQKEVAFSKNKTDIIIQVIIGVSTILGAIYAVSPK